MINKKLKRLFSARIFLIVLPFVILLSTKSKIKLTQLSSKTQDGMMGYVITTGNGKTIVVDGGLKEEADKIEQYIQNYGNKVDYWFITHPHKDHVGAFIEIVENRNIQINNIYYSANPIQWYKDNNIERTDEIDNFYNTLKNEKIKSKIHQPKIGDKIQIDKNIEVEIFGIANPEIKENAINNSSMVFKLHVNDKSIMFLGDTGVESSNKLVNMYTNNELKSDIVQVAHHGNNGATEELYKLIQPEICLWPTPIWLWNNDAGKGYNTANWTTFETKEWMDKLGVKTHYVAKDGDITITVK